MSHEGFGRGKPAGAPRTGPILRYRPERLRLRFTGAKAAETITGLVTSDVLALAPGQGQYSAALTPRGKVIADLRILALEDGFLVDTNEAAARGFEAMVRKYVNPRLARYENLSDVTGDVGLFGAGSSVLLHEALGSGSPSLDLADYAHVSVRAGGESVIVVRVPDFGVEGYEAIGPRPAIEALAARLVDGGAEDSNSGFALLTASRIEAGRPEWGVDMDDSTLAQEADLDRLGAISFTKGCYTGQETVARVHYRGHVNRQLRGLRLGGVALPPAGSELRNGEGIAVGTLLSAAVSPARGPVALAMVRREVEPGAVLVVAIPGAERPVEGMVTALPMTD